MEILNAILVFLSGLIISIAAQARERIEFPPCHDSKGELVRFHEDSPNSTSGGASAGALDGHPGIYFNWYQIAADATSQDTVKFIYMHECGHCALGHIYNPWGSQEELKKRELDADCYAARKAPALGIDLRAVLADVSMWKGDDAHPDGKTRVKNITRCFQEAGGKLPTGPKPRQSRPPKLNPGDSFDDLFPKY